MKDIQIASTKNSPSITYNNKEGILLIKGVCHPENVKEVFNPVFEWFNYLPQQKHLLPNQEIKVVFSFRYLNSASLKHAAMLLQKMNEVSKAGISISVEWQYEEEDEDMKETCIELFSFMDLSLVYKVVPIPYEK